LVLVLLFELGVDQGGCPQVEGGRLGVHEAAHHHQPIENLEPNEDIVYDVDWVLVRILEALQERNYAEGQDKEDRED